MTLMNNRERYLVQKRSIALCQVCPLTSEDHGKQKLDGHTDKEDNRYDKLRDGCSDGRSSYSN